MKSGQYPQPLLRPTFIQAPVVTGYATVRLQAELQMSGTLDGTGTTPDLNDNLTFGLFENTGATAMSLQVRETGDYTSGPSARANVTSVINLVANGGRQQVTFYPQQQYVEIWGVSGGPSDLRLQLSGQVQFELMAFAKNDPTYPPQLWEPASYGAVM